MDKYPGIMIRIFITTICCFFLHGHITAQTIEISPADAQSFGIKSLKVEKFQAHSGADKILQQDQFQFDWNGRIVRRKQVDMLLHLGTEAEFAYDRDGNKIFHAIHLDHSGQKETAQWVCTYEGGKLVLEENATASLVRRRYYNAQGLLARVETWLDGFAQISEETYAYNDRRQLQREIHKMDLIHSVHTYRYDGAGNQISAKQETQYFAEGKSPKFVHETYTYNRYGQITLSQRLNPVGTVLSETSYQYDASGRLVEKVTGHRRIVFERDERGLVVLEVGFAGAKKQYIKTYTYAFWGGEAVSMEGKP